jgi:hypothetical protein
MCFRGFNRRNGRTPGLCRTYGLRLDESTDDVREAVISVLPSAWSKGYGSACVMRSIAFSATSSEPAVLGEWAIFCLYGSLSLLRAVGGWRCTGIISLQLSVIGHLVLT